MRGLLRCSSCGLLAPLCLIGGTSTATAILERYAASFAASGTILEGPDANSHRVRCLFTASRQGATGLSLRGTCRPIWSYRDPSASILTWPPIRSDHRHVYWIARRDGPAHGPADGSRLGSDDYVAEATLRRHDCQSEGHKCRCRSIPDRGHGPHRREWPCSRHN